VPPYYDSLLAKVIVHADDRPAALRGLDRALAQTAVLGVANPVDIARFPFVDQTNKENSKEGKRERENLGGSMAPDLNGLAKQEKNREQKRNLNIED
jgi:acetyl/propionyl-CoA carboxylase alpha subunit